MSLVWPARVASRPLGQGRRGCLGRVAQERRALLSPDHQGWDGHRAEQPGRQGQVASSANVDSGPWILGVRPVISRTAVVSPQRPAQVMWPLAVLDEVRASRAVS
jgi:hypothetical protein